MYPPLYVPYIYIYGISAILNNVTSTIFLCILLLQNKSMAYKLLITLLFLITCYFRIPHIDELCAIRFIQPQPHARLSGHDKADVTLLY